MSLKIFYPVLILFALASCRPDAPKDVMNSIDPDFVAGLQSMKTKMNECTQSDTSRRKTSKIDVSTEGKVSDGVLMCILMDKVAGSGDHTPGCLQLVYFGPYSNDITTDPFYGDDKARYYYTVRLIDTTKWISYSWAPDVSIPAKEEMKMHLRYDAGIPDEIEFD